MVVVVVALALVWLQAPSDPLRALQSGAQIRLADSFYEPEPPMTPIEGLWLHGFAHRSDHVRMSILHNTKLAPGPRDRASLEQAITDSLRMFMPEEVVLPTWVYTQEGQRHWLEGTMIDPKWVDVPSADIPAEEVRTVHAVYLVDGSHLMLAMIGYNEPNEWVGKARAAVKDVRWE